MIQSSRRLAAYLVSAWLLIPAFLPGAEAESGRRTLRGHVPAVSMRLTSKGRLASTNRLHLAIGLALRNPTGLDELLGQLYDPGSTNFHKFITPPEFAARFGPSEADYQAVIDFAETNGLTVTDRHVNRVVLDLEGNPDQIEKAFQVVLLTYRHPTEARDFFAPNVEPSVPANLGVVTIEGLSDYRRPKPLSRKIDPLKIRPLGGSGPGGYYAGSDFRNAYAPGTTLNGAGQSVGLLEFSDYYPSDITSYQNAIGLTNYVPLNTVVIGHPGPGTANNGEVALDIEVAIAMAPGLSQVIVYEIKSGASSILSRMANDNLAKQLSSSWSWSGGPSTTIDNIFKQMAAQGQSFFQASGDSDAYTGTQILDNVGDATAPVDSTNITCVGGTTLGMNGSGTSWSSETVWNYSPLGGANANVGSGGGISVYYTIPYWQASVSMVANSGSTLWRNIPDVALTADGVYVTYNNGSSGGFAGTSCAAPLWAGFCALVNQQAAAASGTSVGFLNPALYAIAQSTNYANCFHDITTGNNIGTNTPGLFHAVSGYDLCTGLGTPNGTNLINALVPYSSPSFVTQPSSQTVTNGASVVFSASVTGQAPLTYRWLFNGTNLPPNGNIPDTTSNVLSIAAATVNDSGNYQLIATNSFGSITSSVAVLLVGFAPGFSAQPTNLTVLAGDTAVFTATATGSAPLTYQWRKNGVNLGNGTGVSGATTNSLALSSVTTNSTGNYSLFVTNNFGVSTSSVAVLTVVLPPSISGSLANQTIECGGSAVFAITASGTPPLNYQWSLDTVPIPGATNSSLSLTDVHLPNHTVAIVVTNLYGSVTSNLLLTVHDTIAPVIAMNGSNPTSVELGAAFADPGASASDACAGALSVSTNGFVDTSAVGTNLLTYAANDGNGNTNTATRTVIVRDTTPPTVLWSFTNLVLAAETNCSSPMPEVTGTNFILAFDLSGPLTMVQSPATNAPLQLGTNFVLITVTDSSSNAVYSTNTIVVEDRTPPVIWGEPQSQTNLVGTVATFNVNAAACTPLAYQWFFNDGALVGQTNSTLTITSVSSTSAGSYAVAVSATGGSSTSSVATLTVVLPPSIAEPLTNQTIECGGSALFAIVASGTPPLNYQWSLDGTPIPGATNASLWLTNVHLPDHSITIAVTNLFASATNSSVLTVRDTIAPLITVNGNDPIYMELGASFADPGAAASDACAGPLSVSLSGSVNTSAVGTNLLTYIADDGNGNTNAATRTVIVRDTIPPTVLWSFTNLVLGAGGSCSAPMPEVTGTNFILASDLSGSLTVVQSPTANTILQLGTNLVLITVTDESGNVAYSTNAIIVQDQTPPVLLDQPQSQTNLVGTVAMFSVHAAACTPVTYRWFFNDAALAQQTNSTLTIASVSRTNAGNYLVTATANGGSSTSTVATLTVKLVSTSVTLNSSANPVGYNEDLSFTALVSPTSASGTIQFLMNGSVLDTQTLVAGQTTSTTLSLLPRGTNLIVAVYSGDTDDAPATNALEQIITNHPPTALTAFFSRTTGSALSIFISDLATNWTDFDGDTVSLADFTVSTNGVSLTNTDGTLSYFDPSDVADQFFCIVSDGWGGTNLQEVNITIIPPTSSPNITSVSSNPDGSFALNLSGTPGHTYVLEAATNLTSPGDWLPIATNTVGTNGVWQFNDARAANFQQQFYRLKLAP